MSTADLRSRAMRGGGISAVAVAAEKTIAVLQLAIVARLLQPEDFGIFALGTVFLIGLTTFTSLGIEKLLVQRPEMTTGFVRSAWAVAVIRGALISMLALFTASFYSDWVSEPLVEPVLSVLALAPLFISLASPNQFLAQRELRFRSLGAFQVVTSLLQFIVFVALTYQLRNVFALAVGQVTMAAVRAVLSWVWFGLPGWPSFNPKYFKELFHVGRHFLVIAVGTFVMTQADNLIVGTLLGAATLGFYALAYKASQFSVDILNTTVGRIILPVFSRLHNEPDRLASAFRETWRLQVALLFPLVAAVAILADEVVLTLYGQQYNETADLLRILALLTLGRGISHLLAPFIIGTGRIGFASRIKIFEAVAFLVVVYASTVWFGASGAAWGTSAVYIFSAGVRVIYVMTYIQLQAAWLLTSMVGAMASAGAAAAVVLVLPFPGPPMVDLVLATFVFGTCYILVSLVLQRDLLPLLKRNLASLRTLRS